MKSFHVSCFRIAAQLLAGVIVSAVCAGFQPAYAGVPGAPTIRSAFPEKNAQATVLFNAPASDGGSPIVSYTVTATPGNIVANGSASPITIGGLGVGTSYTLTVTATNDAGTGPSSGSIAVKARPYTPTSGTINNLAVFIRFSDQPEFVQTAGYYDGLFNSASNSLKNFYLENSYNTLTVNSTLLPSPSGNAIVSYQDVHPTAYYQPYNASTNPIGYQGAESTTRETALIGNALNAVSAQFPGGLNLDSDGDGYIDHISFEVYSTNANPLPGIFFSRATYDTSDSVVVNGLKVGPYTWNTASQDFLAVPLGATEIHEMGHSLGYPDLRGNTGRTPVGNYDVMSISTAATHAGAYEKFRFTNWISAIPEISSYGPYTLNDLTQSGNNAYKIKLANTNEFLILEYRRANGQFESHLPGSGLCVTRVNESAGMWGNLGVPPFFLYYFRVDGTPASDGVGASFTCLSAETGRTQLNDQSNPYCFLSDGNPCGISIYNVGSASGPSISFELGDPSVATVNRVISGYLYNGGSRVSGATVTLSGDASGVTTTDSLGRYLFTVNNGGNYVVTPSKVNLSFSPPNVAYASIAGDKVQNYSATNNTNTISGTVTSGGQPVSGVSVSCTGGNYPAPVTTDASGTYAFTVNAGADYVVRPTKTNYFFAPTTKNFTNVTTDLTGQDFSTSTATVTLSGTVTLNGNPLSGVGVSAPGANTASPVTTTGSGTYSFSVTIGNGSTYTVTPSSAQFKFSPASIFYTGLFSNQVGNFAATALATSATTLGSSSNPSNVGQSVTFAATVTGSAPSGTVTFSDGASTLCSAVALTNGTALCSTSSLGAGSHSIVAVYSGDGNNVGSSSSALNQVVALLGQAITFTSTSPPNATAGGAGYAVAATGGGSGNAIVFTIDANAASVCSISGAMVAFIGAGTCVINANQAGDAVYSAAPQVQQSFSVAAPAAPVVSLSPMQLTFTNQAVGTTSAVKSVTLTNTGNALLTISSIVRNSSVFGVTDNCGGSRAAGASCSLSVTFSPTSAVSTLSSLSVSSNAAGSPHVVTLNGTGVPAGAPVCTLTANPPTVASGGSSTLSSSCTNAPTAYSWTGGTCAGATAATCDVTPASTTDYTVTGSNSAGSGSASATVTVTDPSKDLIPILSILLLN